MAHLFGRLAHVFADREAILERHGLTEDAYRALERRTIEALLGASPTELAHFARTFAEERAELLGLATPTDKTFDLSAHRPPVAPSTSSTQLPPSSQVPASSAPVRVEARTVPQSAYEPGSIDDLMETLHVPTNRNAPPRPK